MKINNLVVFLGTVLALSGCVRQIQRGTLGEGASGYTYVTLDPSAVDIATNGMLTISNLLDALPENAVRISVEQFDTKGNVTYGPAGVSVKGGRYRTTIDYINADTTTIKLFIARSVLVRDKTTFSNNQWFWGFKYINVSVTHEKRLWLAPNETLPANTVAGSEIYWIRRASKTDDSENALRKELLRHITEIGSLATNANKTTNALASTTELLDTSNTVLDGRTGGFFNIPVYIGIGLRVSADIRTYESDINVSGLGTIGASAEAKRLSGSLVVQTLGVNGKSISAALPIQSELNQTTAQNAIVAVGAIKALLYERETVLSPRVVGLYLPFAGGQAVVNSIISELAKQPVEWKPVRAVTK